MNDIITNGTEIKQRVTSEIIGARQCIYLAMAWFTDRDIANAIIDAKNRNVTVDVILSSNASNETVIQMLRDASISVHAFDTGDERGMMHHKFCLVDDKISINGSYNYSYNASNNNVENIQISDDLGIYKQLFTEFERLKYNIDHNINVNKIIEIKESIYQSATPVNIIYAFAQQLHNLIYSTVQVDTEEYKKHGREKSKESEGNIEIFKAEYKNIEEKIRVYATDDSLSNKKDILSANIAGAFASKKAELEDKHQKELTVLKKDYELEKRQIAEKGKALKEEKTNLECGNQTTGEKGLLQTNKEIEKSKLERKSLEQTLVIKEFWSIGTIFQLLGLCIFVYYLSIFFASAMYKVFFEGNFIRNSLEIGINPGLPQIVDANAIVKIFKQEGGLFGIMAALFFLIPVLLSNLKLLGSEKSLINNLCFWVGILIFDVLVSTMVAITTDEIKSLLIGKESKMPIWEVIKHGEFWLIFVFGMLPLIITHFLINQLRNAFRMSQREIVDAEKNKRIQILDQEMLDFNTDKGIFESQIKEKDNLIKENTDMILGLEKSINVLEKQVESKYSELLNQLKAIFDDINTKIISGKIFTEVILSSVITAYKTGFIDYLPSFYADVEVSNRVREIDQFIIHK